MNAKVFITDIQNPDFIGLTKRLDDDLDERYKGRKTGYAGSNSGLCDVVMLMIDDRPAACGALKPYNTETMEIKRVFVGKEYRGNGLAKRIIRELEQAAKSKDFSYAILETGPMQPEAIGLYRQIGYQVIENYGAYKGQPYSICMGRSLCWKRQRRRLYEYQEDCAHWNRRHWNGLR